jgi:predicted regulator of Ras-like GTPase activity (Roadblock/LC7/MglB family)
MASILKVVNSLKRPSDTAEAVAEISWPMVQCMEMTMAPKQEVFDRIINELDEVREVRGCMMVSPDGEVLVTKLDRRLDQEKLAAMSKDMVHTFGKLKTDCNFESPEMMVIEGDEGKVAAVCVDPGLGFVFLLGAPDMSLGMIKMTIRDALEKAR